MPTYKSIKGKYESSHTSPYLGLECSCFSASAWEHCTPRRTLIICPDPSKLKQEAFCFSFTLCLSVKRSPFPPFIPCENDTWGCVVWMMRPDIEKVLHSVILSSRRTCLNCEGKNIFALHPQSFSDFGQNVSGRMFPKHNASLCRLPVVLP